MTKPPAGYAPVYAAIYPGLAEIARSHGYALAVHGSMRRDFDVVAIPWIERPDPPDTVVETMTRKFALRQVGECEEKCHRRMVYTLSVSHGECFLDLSFMPTIKKT
jgi:hypothetical protein